MTIDFDLILIITTPIQSQHCICFNKRQDISDGPSKDANFDDNIHLIFPIWTLPNTYQFYLISLSGNGQAFTLQMRPLHGPICRFWRLCCPPLCCSPTRRALYNGACTEWNNWNEKLYSSPVEIYASRLQCRGLGVKGNIGWKNAEIQGSWQWKCG